MRFFGGTIFGTGLACSTGKIPTILGRRFHWELLYLILTKATALGIGLRFEIYQSRVIGRGVELPQGEYLLRNGAPLCIVACVVERKPRGSTVQA